MDNKEIKTSDISIACLLMTLGLPLKNIYYDKTIFFVFQSNMEAENTMLLYQRNFSFIKEKLYIYKKTKKIEKEKTENPYGNMKDIYQELTHGIKGAPRSKSNGVYRQ